MQGRMESLTGGHWGHLWGKTPSRAQLFSFWLCQTQTGESCEHQLLPFPASGLARISSHCPILTLEKDSFGGGHHPMTLPLRAPDPCAWWERAGISDRVSLQLGGVLTHGVVPHHVTRAPVLTQPTL